MKRIALLLALTIVLPVALAAQAPAQKTPPPSVAGKWSMTLETPHGKMTATFDLKVDGQKVTGTFASDHSEKANLTGKFVDGKLAFKIDGGDLTFTATMKDADTLSGVVSSERGDLVGVAKREKVKSQK